MNDLRDAGYPFEFEWFAPQFEFRFPRIGSITADGFALELRQALEDHGVPVKMVLYDGFGHPVNKPKQQRAVMEENENWFDHYIWGDPLAESLTPVVKAKP